MPLHVSSTDSSDQVYTHLITINGSTDQLIGSLYINPSPATVQHFKSINHHLGPNVRPGRLAIVSPPDSFVCTLAEAELQAIALLVDQRLQAMDEEEAEIAARHHDLLSNIANRSGIGYGIAMNYFKRKRLANYIFPGLCRVRMMIPSYIDRQGIHHESELIEKRGQSPALA